MTAPLTLPPTQAMPMRAALLLVLLLAAANFGIFYAWICTTMWGLDTAAPLVAVKAMQAMNASVRNGVFAVPFFGSTAAVLVVALWALAARQPGGIWLLAAAAVLLGGNLVLTFTVLVPMNEALGAQSPLTEDEAQTLWDAYSPRWQSLNTLRTAACGVGFALALVGAGRIFSRPRRPVR